MDNDNQLPPAPVAEELSNKPMAFSRNGNLFWYGDPTERRDVNCDLYIHPQSAVPEQLTPDTAEHKLQKSGVFKGADGLRRIADADEFWESQNYGTRLYFGSGISDYLHRDVLRTAIKLLDSAPAKPAIDADALAEFIRDMDDGEYIPYHELAQRICNWIEEQSNDQ